MSTRLLVSKGDVPSPVPWVSHGDVGIENSSPSSGSSSIFEEQVQPDILEGFDRVRDLVDELLSVDTSFNVIEANAQFVHGLLRNLSDNITDNWGNDGNEELGEDDAANDKKVQKKEAWVAHLGQGGDSQEAETDQTGLLHCSPISLARPINEKSPMKTDCSTSNSTSSTSLATSYIDD